METTESQKHIVSIFALSNPRTLMKVSSIFARRSLTIESLNVSKIRETELVQFTVAVNASDEIIEQVQKQLYKIIETVRVIHVKPKSMEVNYGNNVLR